MSDTEGVGQGQKPVTPGKEDELKKLLIGELNQILRERKPIMLRNYPYLRDSYRQEYGLPEIDPIRYEVALCLIFGLYQATIALSNHLLESLLKYALIYHHALQHKKPEEDICGRAIIEVLHDWLAEGKSRYADKNLYDTINQACKVGLISKEQKDKLHQIREAYRNAYGHADKEKLFGNETTPIAAVRFEGDQMVHEPTVDARMADFLIGQGVFQAAYAEQDARPYFLYVDGLARQIISKLFPGANEGEESCI